MELDQDINDKLVEILNQEINKQVVQLGFEPNKGNDILLSKRSLEVELKQSNILVVSAFGIPSTGYLWNLKPDNESTVKLAFELIVPSSMPGAMVEKCFIFKGVTEGTVNLYFSYKRPWENSAPLKEYKIIVKSQGQYSGSFGHSY